MKLRQNLKVDRQNKSPGVMPELLVFGDRLVSRKTELNVVAVGVVLADYVALTIALYFY